jgi:hypothetical protein
LQQNPCIVFTSDVEHRDNSDSVHETFQCELQGDDRGGKNYAWVIIRGLPSPWTEREKIISGVTTFFAQNAVIDDSTYELLLPKRAVIKVWETITTNMEGFDFYLTAFSYQSYSFRLS